MKKRDSVQSPDSLHYTRYYEHDGMLRAYANGSLHGGSWRRERSPARGARGAVESKTRRGRGDDSTDAALLSGQAGRNWQCTVAGPGTGQ